jgi:hypothetical protein
VEEWIGGSGPPAPDLGQPGDWYLDIVSDDVYEKTGHTTWTFRTNIKGASGSGAVSADAGNQATLGSDSLIYVNLNDVFMRWVPYTGPPQSFIKQDMTRDGDWTMVANKNTSDRPAPQQSGPEDDLLPSWVPTTQSARATYTVYNEWTLSQGGWIDKYGGDVIQQNLNALHTITLSINGVVKDTFTSSPVTVGPYFHDITPLVALSGSVIRVTVKVNQVSNNNMYWFQQVGLFTTAPTYCSLAQGSKDGAAASSIGYGCHVQFIPGTASPDWDVVAFGGTGGGAAAGAATLPATGIITAANRVIANLLAQDDTQPSWEVLGDGTTRWGLGGTTAFDVNLYRSAAGTLKTDSALTVMGLLTVNNAVLVQRAGGSTAYYAYRVGVDAQPRYTVDVDGKTSWGPGGSTTVDSNLYRAAAGQLRTDGSLIALALNLTLNGTAGQRVQRILVSGDAQSRLEIDNQGKQQWGDGTAAVDTNLYRAAASILRTDGSLQVGNQVVLVGATSNFTARSATAATTQIFNSRVSADTADRFILYAGGQLNWGDGTNPTDVTLYRGGVSNLSLGTSSQRGYFRIYGAGAGDGIIYARVTTDPAERFYITAVGAHSWGDGTNPADVTLSRSSPSNLSLGTTSQRGYFRVFGSGSGDGILYGRVTTDAQERWYVTASGGMNWGDGTNPTDTNLYRGGSGLLQSDGQIRSMRGLATQGALGASVTGDAQSRFSIIASGTINWGTGATATDTNLYRGGAAQLKTDGDLVVGGALSAATPQSWFDRMVLSYRSPTGVEMYPPGLAMQARPYSTGTLYALLFDPPAAQRVRLATITNVEFVLNIVPSGVTLAQMGIWRLSDNVLLANTADFSGAVGSLAVVSRPLVTPLAMPTVPFYVGLLFVFTGTAPNVAMMNTVGSIVTANQTPSPGVTQTGLAALPNPLVPGLHSSLVWFGLY